MKRLLALWLVVQVPLGMLVGWWLEKRGQRR
jgi:hypothetical protein